MAKYLSLIRKQDFSDLYTYGIFHTNRDMIIEVSGSIDYIKSQLNYFKSITAFANSFDMSFTYLFVLYEKINTENRICDIEIENVLNLFPLNNEAKILLQEDFGSQIRFEEPLWPNAIEELKISQKIIDCQKGIKNIWKIFGMPSKQMSECKAIVPDNIIKEVVREKFTNTHPAGDLPLWVYMLRYERHAMYPNTTLGFYMDAVHVATNFSKKKRIPKHRSIRHI